MPKLRVSGKYEEYYIDVKKENKKMKIRTDFVTNSSSSSFVVDLTVEFADGKKMNITEKSLQVIMKQKALI